MIPGPMSEADWVVEPPAAGAEVAARHDANRRAWDSGAARYAATLADRRDALRQGRSTLHPVEQELLAGLGSLEQWCRRAVHLQCASGADTLSLWLAGAHEVVGVDFSSVQVSNARWLAAELEAPAEFLEADVLDLPAKLDGGADLVWATQGALCWLHDLAGWANTVARLLRPTGVALIFDEHPVTWLFDAEGGRLVRNRVAYFDFAVRDRGCRASYLDDGVVQFDDDTEPRARLWPLGEVHGCLTGAGLRVDHLAEHPDAFSDRWPDLPPSAVAGLPRTFSLIARPAG